MEDEVVKVIAQYSTRYQTYTYLCGLCGGVLEKGVDECPYCASQLDWSGIPEE